MSNSHPTVLQRATAELPLKLFLLVALNAAVWTPYMALQRIHFFDATVMPLSAIDRAIPFTPAAVWPYLSIYALLPIGPFLFTERPRIFAYAKGVLAMAAVATIIFIFYPTICERPDPSLGNDLYRSLVAFDNPYHSLPSLHAAFAIYSALCAIESAAALRAPAALKPTFWLWAAAILYGTLATRQHVFLDIAAGGILGFAAYKLSLAPRQTSRILNPHGVRHET